jgi:hypothetical protein
MEPQSIVAQGPVPVKRGVRRPGSADVALACSVVGLLLCLLPWADYVTLGVAWLRPLHRLVHGPAELFIGVAVLAGCALAVVGIVVGIRLRRRSRREPQSCSPAAGFAVCLSFIGLVAILSFTVFELTQMTLLWFQWQPHH